MWYENAPHKPKKGRSRLDDTIVLSAIFYRLRIGCPWRDVPTHFGPWKSIYTRFRRWCKNGLWEYLWKESMKMAEPCASELRHLDSNQHKAYKHAQVGPEPIEGRRIRKTKGGSNTKLNAITDSRRRLIAMSLTEGQQSEYDGAIDLLEHCENKIIAADKGYDSDPFRILIEDWGNNHCIPSRSNRKIKIEVDKNIYKKRHNVENFFCWIKEYRWISTRYEQTLSSFMGLIMLAATILWIKSPF